MIPTVLALVVALLMPIQHAGSTGCTDVHVIGARGSGQSGYGEQVRDVVVGAARQVLETGRTVGAHALDYPAISLADSLGLALINGDYDRSIQEGVVALKADLDRLRTECPSTQIVLVGYSQGAQVIKTAMENRAPVDRISAVVLLADPTREIVQRGIVRLGSEATRRGALGSIPLPDHLRTVAIDVCAEGDAVCGGEGFFGHIDGYKELTESVLDYLLAEIAASPLAFFRAA